ncbi:carbon-nitrogen hydrolase family protein [Brevibacterium daeguense]|uniref:Carbon-nitrogen hydrolase family protein n=1 Tax=Brevibacterium daeguense TaxID=909936 RepID=A0ABP8EM11_9MICO|nr:carbon-nitrogen hydrolase family protein [Brevibacterium daeguense]
MTTVAAVQIGSVPFDAAATAEKICAKLAEAAATGAELAVFPEATLGTYPKGLTFGAPVGRRTDEGRDQFEKYFANAVTLDGPELSAIAEAAARTGVFTVLGIIERAGRTLYCTAVHIDPERGPVGHHRKLMPTGGERLIWGFGDGSTLPVVDSPAGRTGAVICWENYMPLMRQAMYAQGVEVYCAPTVDDRDSWQHTMAHIGMEGRCFVISACQAIRAEDYGEDYAGVLEPNADGWLIRGGSAIYDSSGTALAGPVYDAEAILTADIDVSALSRTVFDFDPVGHYARPDVFRLSVDTRPKPSVEFGG